MGQAPTGVLVVAPSTVQVDRPFPVRVKLLTEPYYADEGCFSGSGATSRPKSRYNRSPVGIRYMDNVPLEWTGSLVIEGGDGFVGPPASAATRVWGAFADDPGPSRPSPRSGSSAPGFTSSPSPMPPAASRA